MSPVSRSTRCDRDRFQRRITEAADDLSTLADIEFPREPARADILVVRRRQFSGRSDDRRGWRRRRAVETTTITITNAGVTPQSIIVNANAKVTFVNNDSARARAVVEPAPVAHAVPRVQHGQHRSGPEPGIRIGRRWTDVRLS